MHPVPEQPLPVPDRAVGERAAAANPIRPRTESLARSPECVGSYLLLAIACVPAWAQDQDVQRALIQRDQQSAEYALRLRQSQENPQPAPGDNRHLEELQRQQNAGEQQLQSVQKDTPQSLRPYERQNASREFVLRLPPPAARTELPGKLRPLPAKMPPAVEVVP